MSHRMTVMTRGLALLMSLCLLSDVGEAGQRRRRARYCQPTCCQPQPVCCQAAPVACAPTSDVKYFCAWWKVCEFGSVAYYYAPHCPGNPSGLTPMMVAGPNVSFDPMMLCGNAANEALCVFDGTSINTTYRTASLADRSRRSGVLVSSRAELNASLGAGHAGPERPNPDLDISRVGNKWHYLKFSPKVNGTTIPDVIAKAAQFNIAHKDDPDPSHVPVRIALGHEVRNYGGDTINVTDDANIEPVVGNPYAFNVTATIPNTTTSPASTVEVTFLVVIRKRP